MLKEIYEFDNFLSDKDYEIVWSEFNKFDWTFTAKASAITPIPVRRFWYKELKESQVIEKIFKNKIENILNKEVSTTRLYGNGQAHGQTAWVHQDESLDNFGSLVYYLHKDWAPHYGGHLIFIENTNPPRVIKSVFPSTNSAVVFDSTLFHCALEPTVYCTEQRISIAYKFKIHD